MSPWGVKISARFGLLGPQGVKYLGYFKIIMGNVRNVEFLGIVFWTTQEIQFLELREQQATCLEMDFFCLWGYFYTFSFYFDVILTPKPSCLSGYLYLCPQSTWNIEAPVPHWAYRHFWCQNIFITHCTSGLFYQIKHYQAIIFILLTEKSVISLR